MSSTRTKMTLGRRGSAASADAARPQAPTSAMNALRSAKMLILHFRFIVASILFGLEVGSRRETLEPVPSAKRKPTPFDNKVVIIGVNQVHTESLPSAQKIDGRLRLNRDIRL